MNQHNAKDTTSLTLPSWSIQTANWRDFSELNQLERVCFSSDDLWPIWDLIGVLALPGVVRFKAVSDDHMIGFIGGERRGNQQMGWVTTLAVHPEYRRLGIALALLKKCEQTLDLPTIRLSVRASNHPAIQLYEQHGYIRINRWTKYYAGGEDALVFEKRR